MNDKIKLLKESIISCTDRYADNREEIDVSLSLLNDIKDLLNNDTFINSFSIGFAEYIAKEHYTLVNQIGNIHYWKNEEFLKTTRQLIKDYKNTL